MFIVPDEILEQLICSYCHKYLSVGPLKVDNNRKKICGRCAKNRETEAVSMYRFFLENAIFKCINRFDGCNQLLTCHEVIEHEKNCIGNRYECPLCENIREMPSYDFLHHFKNRHSQNFLKKPTLKRKLDELQPLNTFLFVKENVIFIILLECPMFIPTAIVLKAFYIVKNDKLFDIKLSMDVHIDDKRMFKTKETICLLAHKKYELMSRIADIVTNYDTLQKGSYLVIDFDFSVPLTVNQINLNNKKQYSKNMTNTRLMVTESSEHLKKFGLSVSDCSKKLLLKDVHENQLEIDVKCLHCSTMSADNIYITSDGKDRFLICQWCAPVAKSDFFLLKCIVEGGIETVSKYLKFSCVWNCGVDNHVNDIHKHELNCLKMNKPIIKCPFPKCQFNGMFEEMHKHFYIEHEETLWSNFIHLYESSKTSPNHNILSLSDKTLFYFWVHPIVLLKCVVTINNDKTIKIRVLCADKAINVDNIKVIVFNKSDKNGQKFCLDFTNESDSIDLKLLPIRLHFIII